MTANTRALVLVSLVAFRNPSRDVEDDGVALVVFDQRVLAQVAEECLLDELDAAEIHQHGVVLEAPVEDHAHLPRPRVHVRVGQRHLVVQRVGSNRREPLHDFKRVTVEIPGARQPRAVVEVRHVDHERVAFPAAH